MDKSVPLIRAPELWQRGVTGKGVLVGVGDTGFTSHGDLDSVIVKKIPYDDGSTKDGFGHGTAVSSVIAGQAVKSNGKYKGVAPDARIVMAKVLGDDGSGSYESIMGGIQALADYGAQIINLSLGSDGPADGSDPISLLMDQLSAEKGVTFVCAAGNADGGANSMMLGSPAAARCAIAVAACGKTTKDLAEFSSRGPTADGRKKPEVTAPGGMNSPLQWIIMARAPGTTMGIPLSADYISAPGTSFASPHVAGLCALLKQAYPDAAPEALREMLIKGTGGQVWDSGLGYGVVDAVKSIEAGNGGNGGGEPEPEPKKEIWLGVSVNEGQSWIVLWKFSLTLGAKQLKQAAPEGYGFWFGMSVDQGKTWQVLWKIGLRLTTEPTTFVAKIRQRIMTLPSLKETVQSIIALLVTVSYLGWIWLAYLRGDSVMVDFLWKASWGPALIWGWYFTRTATAFLHRAGV